MAELVAAVVASHAPLITANPESAGPERHQRVHAAMRRLGAQLKETNPTAIVICSNEHFTNFFYDNLPAFCVGMADKYQGPVEEWLNVERGFVPGQAELGRWIVTHALEHDFDLSYSHELRLDHGMMTVLHFLTPEMDVPIVPIIQNCSVKPMPTLRRCYQLGQELRRAIDEWGALGQRVALIGAGGLSHWVGLPEMGRVNEEWDRWFLGMIESGRTDELLSMTEAEVEAAGNGAHEIRSWLPVAGAVGGGRARIEMYEPVSAWATGMGAASYELAG
jgi:aromatic ring-opening dioxygenase catalytic subunit (LigB family)